MKTILLVEDEFTLRRALGIFLEDEGYDVVAVTNGEEAWVQAQEDVFDLVLTDLRMPVMDGIELVKRLRSLPQYTKTPIFILSANNEQSLVDAGLQAGATGWLNKPFPVERLLEVVQQALA